MQQQAFAGSKCNSFNDQPPAIAVNARFVRAGEEHWMNDLFSAFL